MESKIRHNESIYETETESKRREQTCGCQGGGGKDWEFETSSCKLVYTLAVLNLLGTREWFYGRQFFHGLTGMEWGRGVMVSGGGEWGGFRMIQAHCISYALYFYYY